MLSSRGHIHTELDTAAMRLRKIHFFMENLNGNMPYMMMPMSLMYPCTEMPMHKYVSVPNSWPSPVLV